MNAAPTARLLTAPARGGIAVISVCGPGAQAILSQVFLPRVGQVREGQLALGWIADDGRKLDEAILTPVSADCLEINIHGGPQVARAVLALLERRGCQIQSDPGLDPALTKPHPRWDNPAIAEELLAVLPQARTELAVAALAYQWSGGLSELLGGTPAPGQLQSAAEAYPRMHRLLAPAEVVIAGPVNAGKSSLANALVGRATSIVSERAGTTRDWVRTLADLDGVPVWLTDTAGLWESSADLGEIDSQAVNRVWQRVAQADVVIALVSGPGGFPAGDNAQQAFLDRLTGLPNVMRVSGKADAFEPAFDLAVSSQTLAGLPQLKQAIRQSLGLADFDPRRAMAFTTRQRDLISSALAAMAQGQPTVAAQHLRKITGGK